MQTLNWRGQQLVTVVPTFTCPNHWVSLAEGGQQVQLYSGVTGGVGAQGLLDIHRQQLPFGALVFPVPDRFDMDFNNSTQVEISSSLVDGLTVDLPKINAMIDRHTDDGSVISRHYSATLVESAWRNRLNNSTMAFLLENTSMDVSTLSLFSACYLSSIMLMSLSRKQLSEWRGPAQASLESVSFVHVKLIAGKKLYLLSELVVAAVTP